MSKFIVAPQANRDLLEILEHIATDNPVAAGETVLSLEKRFHLLGNQPELGRLRPSLGKNTRSFPVKNYVIFYRIIPTGIEISRVLHGKRNIRPLIE